MPFVIRTKKPALNSPRATVPSHLYALNADGDLDSRCESLLSHVARFPTRAAAQKAMRDWWRRASLWEVVEVSDDWPCSR